MLIQAVGGFLFLRSLVTFRDIRKLFYALVVGSAGAVFLGVVALTYAGNAVQCGVICIDRRATMYEYWTIL